MTKKLLVLGLDGASFPVLSAYAGEHPDGLFARWLSEGYCRVLLSTSPCFTAPAWTTFMTGLDPGQHGMYHWRGRWSPDLGDRPLLCSRHLEEATFWWYCQRHGRRVSVSNFPMQYPAPPTHGRYLCGTLAPESAPDVTWPPGLARSLRAALPGYRFEMDKGLSYLDRPAELRDHILEVGRNHARAVSLLLDAGTADLLVHVVTMTDRMQHFFWHCFDPRHPGHAGPTRDQVGNPVLEVYAVAEATLEEAWERQAWDNAILVSDHGMGLSTVSFHTDAWLASRGYAQWARNGAGAKSKVAPAASLAYSGEEPECAVYVNRQDRDGCGIEPERYPAFTQQLRRELLALHLPGGSPAFTAVRLQQELYQGRSAQAGPDLVLLPSDGVHPRPGWSTDAFGHATRLFAGHRPEGIFCGYGTDFPRSPAWDETPPLHIRDVFPLMCVLAGLPIPGGLSGELPEDWRSGAPERDPAWDWREQVQGSPLPQAANPDMLARLAELGYL